VNFVHNMAATGTAIDRCELVTSLYGDDADADNDDDDCNNRSGRHLTDDEISGMLIGLLLAGQHTSSTTSAWLGFFLAKHPDIQVI